MWIRCRRWRINSSQLSNRNENQRMLFIKIIGNQNVYLWRVWSSEKFAHRRTRADNSIRNIVGSYYYFWKKIWKKVCPAVTTSAAFVRTISTGVLLKEEEEEKKVKIRYKNNFFFKSLRFRSWHRCSQSSCIFLIEKNIDEKLKKVFNKELPKQKHSSTNRTLFLKNSILNEFQILYILLWYDRVRYPFEQQIESSSHSTTTFIAKNLKNEQLSWLFVTIDSNTRAQRPLDSLTKRTIGINNG